MPTADPFNAAGRRNGLPFTLVAATDSDWMMLFP